MVEEFVATSLHVVRLVDLHRLHYAAIEHQGIVFAIDSSRLPLVAARIGEVVVVDPILVLAVADAKDPKRRAALDVVTDVCCSLPLLVHVLPVEADGACGRLGVERVGERESIALRLHRSNERPVTFLQCVVETYSPTLCKRTINALRVLHETSLQLCHCQPFWAGRV